MKKAGRIIKKGLLLIVALGLIVLLGMTIYQGAWALKYAEKVNQIGETVNVNGKEMQVAVEGEGTHTIVLLSGLGTYSPIEDFKPLAEQLSSDFRVVTIEYPGYGMSKDTKELRTSENIVEEIRGALQQLEIKPPYTLAAHSISGIYALEYINLYPEEIEAFVGIDPSVPKQMAYEEEMQIPQWLYYPSRLFDIVGISRMELKDDSLLAGMRESGSYSEQDLDMIKAVKGRRSASRALINENNSIAENLNALSQMTYPNNLMVLTFLAEGTETASDAIFAEKGYDISWKRLHEELITNPGIQTIKELPGEHYLHWTNSKEIADGIKQMF